MFKKVPLETKEEILTKIKNGETVIAVANQYGIRHDSSLVLKTIKEG